jgi:hypothetical protein
MSKQRDISSIWRGLYFYDTEEMQQFYGKGIEFELHLTQSRWQRIFRRFSGTVCDRSDLGIPGEGYVHGRYHGETIFLTKFMPNFYLTDGTKVILLEEYLPQFGYGTRTGLAHPPIYYRGVFEDDGYVSGKWVVEPVSIFLGDSDRAAYLPFPETTGTFTMCRH